MTQTRWVVASEAGEVVAVAWVPRVPVAPSFPPAPHGKERQQSSSPKWGHRGPEHKLCPKILTFSPFLQMVRFFRRC